MREYGVYEAKTKLAELLKYVQQGEHVTITNRGEPVAEVIPSHQRAKQQTEHAIKSIRAMKKGAITQESFEQMRQDGRR